MEFEFEPINNYGNHEFSKFKVIIPNSSCLTVYPNPFTDYVMLNYSTNNAIDGAIKISDISGKVVLQIPVKYSAANIKIDVSSLVAGNYIVMLEGKDGIIEKSKLVIYK
ncbi:MAG: T9SS type A sorting domain-containing protein [Bacteroidia bacterium]